MQRLKDWTILTLQWECQQMNYLVLDREASNHTLRMSSGVAIKNACKDGVGSNADWGVGVKDIADACNPVSLVSLFQYGFTHVFNGWHLSNIIFFFSFHDSCRRIYAWIGINTQVWFSTIERCPMQTSVSGEEASHMRTMESGRKTGIFCRCPL